jgi:hypothetical protein
MNDSKQSVKWMALLNGQWEGHTLNPGQYYTMDDAGVTWAGWLLSDFVGFTSAAVGSQIAPGYSAMLIAFDNAADAEVLSSKLKGLASSPDGE